LADFLARHLIDRAVLGADHAGVQENQIETAALEPMHERVDGCRVIDVDLFDGNGTGAANGRRRVG